MSKPWVACDLETRAIRSIADDPAYWERRARDIRAPANYKDPIKIDMYRNEKIETLKEEMALSPMTGEIVVIGLMGDAPKPMILTDKTERDLLVKFAGFVRELRDHAWVGFNIRQFDIPFLWVRMAMHLIEAPLPAPKDYNRVGELRDILTAGPLGEWMQAFGWEGKPFPDEDIRNLSVEKLAQRCEHDVTCTRMLGERLQGALTCLR